jgi:hypothetical protein
MAPYWPVFCEELFLTRPNRSLKETVMKTRNLTLALLASTTLFSVACSSLEISTDYDPSVAFGSYKTFAFKDGAKAKNSLAQSRFQIALTQALEARGLGKATADADLKVFTHFVLGKDVRLNSYGYGMGGWYGYRWGGGMGSVQVQEIPTGMIVVDMVDTKENRLVWRGTAKDRISRDSTPEERQGRVKEAVEKMLANFPPVKK